MRNIGIECEALEGPTWGMGRQIRKLLEGLAARTDLAGRFRFILYSNNPLPSDPLYDHPLFIRRPCGLKAVLGSWAPSSFSVHYFVLLPLRLLLDRPAVMYFPNYMLPIGTPVRSLVMLTDDIFREAYNPALPLRYRLAYRIYATFWAKHRATRIMAISNASAAALREKGIPAGRIAVNEMGVTTSPQQTANNEQHSEKLVDFLFVGQAFERRCLKETLMAFADMASNRPELSFRFIGKDKYPVPTIAPLIEHINARLGRTAVTSQEYVPDADLAAAYRAARALVYVSDTEGFGMPPLEALSYGTPPVVADTPVNREIYGRNAFLVPLPITGDGIRIAMEHTLNDADSRARIIAAGPGIVARYGWQAHADRFVTIITGMTS